MPHQIERNSVEDYLVEKLQERGWKVLDAKELIRESYEESLLLKNLIECLKRINLQKGIELSDTDIKQVLNELKLRATGIEGQKQILSFFKRGISIKLEKTKDLVRVHLFDYDNLKNNEFILSRQVVYQSANDEKRSDIMLYVNGIPLVIIECKNPADFSISWKDAYDQIKEYEKAIPDLFKYVQIGVAAEQVAKYFPIVTWQESKVYEWKEDKLEKGKDVSLSSIVDMLDPFMLLDIIKNYLFFREEGKQKTKVMARYMQHRAVEKVINRVRGNIKGIEKKNKGLIWHWQGSGKTLTMIFSANKLYPLRELANPTIFFILDRIELEEQFYNEFSGLDLGVKVEKIVSIRELKNILLHDNGKGKRGLFTVLVHKFRENELKEADKILKEISKENQTILDRKNIIAFVDEGHRTQYGLLAAQMRAILKNAFFFAFTGTPIAKKEKNTYEEFSYLPEEPYLDKYFITDSINDGFTVRIAYQPTLEKNVELKKDMLKTFLDVQFDEIPEKEKEIVQEEIKGKINFMKAYLKNPERIAKIAKNIAEHFKENLNGKFKGMVVAVDRSSCVNYKKELDKLLPPEYSEVVMTFNQGDSLEIIKYYKELQERYPNKDTGEIIKEITTKFKEEENPKILIVTDMLLTGFDAPILQTMYLDKPMKEHKLLQAIARTNRPYKEVKEAGLIMDYLGILKYFKKAFDLYSKKDLEGALINRDELIEDFKKLIKETIGILSGVNLHGTKMEDFIKALEILSLEENSDKFIESYKQLRKLFELLGADPRKVEHAEDFFWLSKIYVYYMRQRTQKEDFEDSDVDKYFAKTIKFIHKTTKIEDLKKDLPIINFDEQYIKHLEEKYKSKEEKAANIIFTLNRLVLVEQHDNPIYESLLDKVSRLIDLWKEKTKDFEKIYRGGLKAIEERNLLLKRQKELGLNNFEYSTLILLENKIGKEKNLVKEVIDFSKSLERYMFTNWELQVVIKKSIEKEIRSFLLKLKQVYKLKLSDVDEISYKIFESLKKYGKRN